MHIPIPVQKQVTTKLSVSQVGSSTSLQYCRVIKNLLWEFPINGNHHRTANGTLINLHDWSILKEVNDREKTELSTESETLTCRGLV